MSLYCNFPRIEVNHLILTFMYICEKQFLWEISQPSFSFSIFLKLLQSMKWIDLDYLNSIVNLIVTTKMITRQGGLQPQNVAMHTLTPLLHVKTNRYWKQYRLTTIFVYIYWPITSQSINRSLLTAMGFKSHINVQESRTLWELPLIISWCW